MWNPFLTILIAIISAIASSYLTFIFTSKSKKYETLLRLKEERYSKLMVLSKAFYGSGDKDKVRLFLDEYYKCWLFASDDVIRSAKTVLDVSTKIHNQEHGTKPDLSSAEENAGPNLIMAMRKDLLGNMKTKLLPSDFIYLEEISERNKN